jgi:ABC-type antimicrobial peptide transport system permease subunit
LLLASVGVVGLVMYTVSQRTKEIGSRMALGATSARVLSSVLGRFARPVVAGLIAGVAGAALLSQILRRVLFGVRNLDPVAYLSAIVVFLVIVALAALVPARRALGVDPLLSLRDE